MQVAARSLHLQRPPAKTAGPSEMRFSSLTKLRPHQPRTLGGNPFPALALCCQPQQTRSGLTPQSLAARVACQRPLPNVSLQPFTVPLLRGAGEDLFTPRAGQGVGCPAFPAKANPSVSLPYSAGLVAGGSRRSLWSRWQVPEPDQPEILCRGSVFRNTTSGLPFPVDRQVPLLMQWQLLLMLPPALPHGLRHWAPTKSASA